MSLEMIVGRPESGVAIAGASVVVPLAYVQQQSARIAQLEANAKRGPFGQLTATEKMEAQLRLIRVILGLNPIHDPVECVRVLLDEGRGAFEALRGLPCQHAHEWKPQ